MFCEGSRTWKSMEVCALHPGPELWANDLATSPPLPHCLVEDLVTRCSIRQCGSGYMILSFFHSAYRIHNLQPVHGMCNIEPVA
jgi:hypothetical protein